MDRGIYAAGSGGLLESRRLQVTANNMANVSTVGFKAQRLVAREQEFGDTLAATLTDTPSRVTGDHERIPGVTDVQTITDFTPGPVSNTGNPLNVALRDPDTFFVVNTPEGELYTRAGNFTLDSQGILTTPDGYPVLGEGGPITINQGSPRISSSGAVTSDGTLVGRLRTVRVEDLTQLERKDGARFALPGGGEALPVRADVIPESVEMPNVNVVESMVDMMGAQRSFEAYTKTVQTIDELNSAALRTARITG
ncbi:MAG: flagellar hook-basal body protein [Bdellovibrionales bacterium]|nr:flagellar hook-basal body protein [Bdellovibrionales bacterium]